MLAARPEAIDRFMQAYREAYQFLYSDPRALAYFADIAKVSERLAGQIRDTFLPKQAMAPDRVSGTDASMADAVAAKMLAAQLTPAQLDQLIRIPPPH